MKAKHLFILVVISILSSCCHEIQCTNTGVIASIGLTSFTAKEIDTLILRRFTKGSNFTTPIDTAILDANNCRIGAIDSFTYQYIEESAPITITSDYDFEIFVPATNTLAKIDNISEPQTQEKSCPSDGQLQSCINPIDSYRLNGQETATINYNIMVINK